MSQTSTRTAYLTRKYLHYRLFVIGLFSILMFLGAPLYVGANEDGSTEKDNTSVSDHSKKFEKLLSDPEELRNFVNYVHAEMPDTGLGNYTDKGSNLTLVGIATDFPLYDSNGSETADGAYFGLTAGIQSQFNVDKKTDDLLNTNFQVGFPFKYRWGGASFRLRLMHQSSHVGDDLLTNGGTTPAVRDLSIEFADFILSYDHRDVRFYAGGAYRFDQETSGPNKGNWKGGFEFVDSTPGIYGFQPMVAFNVTSKKATDWEEQYSFRVGLRNRNWFWDTNSIDIMLHGYDGPLTFGQFYRTEAEYYGIGIYFNT